MVIRKRIGIMFIAVVVIAIYYSDNSKPEPAPSSCNNDYKMCKDNADLINNYYGMIPADVACESATSRVVKYGKPQWPSVPFASFYKGDNYPKKGIVIINDRSVLLQNRFGAMARSVVTCTYDLKHKDVISISINGVLRAKRE